MEGHNKTQEDLPGYPVTADSPPINSIVLLLEINTRLPEAPKIDWNVCQRKQDGWYFAIEDTEDTKPKPLTIFPSSKLRWAYLPGEAPLERLLALPIFSAIVKTLSGHWYCTLIGYRHPQYHETLDAAIQEINNAIINGKVEK